MILPVAVADGEKYGIALRGDDGFVFNVTALNHPHEASCVVISSQKKCVRWMVAVLRSAEKKLEDKSILDRSLVVKQAADLRRAIDIIVRQDTYGTGIFLAEDIPTASVVVRALISCRTTDMKAAGNAEMAPFYKKARDEANVVDKE